MAMKNYLTIPRLIEEKTFGDITIQKRIIPKDKKLLIDSQGLSSKEVALIKNTTERIEARYYCSIDY